MQARLDLSSLKASKILEFLRINLEFLKDCFARNDKILEFIEIASVALLPRNDEILEFPIEIPQRGWGMTQKAKSEDDIVGNFR